MRRSGWIDGQAEGASGARDARGRQVTAASGSGRRTVCLGWRAEKPETCRGRAAHLASVRAGILSVAATLVASGVSGQIVGPKDRQVDTQMDMGSVDAFVFDVGVEALPRLSGEAFEGVKGGWRVGVSTGAHFASGHVVRIHWATGRYRDTLAGTRANSTTVAVTATWEGRVNSKLVLEGGPALGYTWLSRSIYEERARGPVFGLVAAAARQIHGRFEVRASASIDWCQFRHTTVINMPADPDGEALGTRLGLVLGIGYVLRQ